MRQRSGRDESGLLAGAGIKGLLIVIVLVAAMIAVAAAATDDDRRGDETPTEETPGTTVPDDGGSDDQDIITTTTATGSEKKIDLKSTDVLTGTVSEDKDGGTVEIRVSLAEEEASKYTSFRWYVKDSSGSYIGSVSKTEPFATWTIQDSDIGSYTFGVRCEKNSDQGFRPGGMSIPWMVFTEYVTHDMQIVISGTVTKELAWTYDGRSYTTTVTYDYSEFERYSTGDLSRSLKERSTFDDLTGFIVVNDVVQGIADDLESKYAAAYGGSAEGQPYAEFVLAFVQTAFSYQYDERLYKQDEYYAFPMETIQNLGGDCEDTSILCAALDKASGYDAGVFLIPGHCIAAVAVDGYVPGTPDASYSSKVKVFSYAQDGRTYYGCETTLEQNLYGVGWVSDAYSIDSDGEITYTSTDIFGRTSTSTSTVSDGRTVTYKELGYGLYTVPASA